LVHTRQGLGLALQNGCLDLPDGIAVLIHVCSFSFLRLLISACKDTTKTVVCQGFSVIFIAVENQKVVIFIYNLFC
jgi:hypothetical protein